MSNSFSGTRRQFLKSSGFLGAGSLLFATHPKAGAQIRDWTSAGYAKNIIFLVVDGLSHGTLGYANQWKLRHTGSPVNLNILLNCGGVRRALQETASADSPVTDSAAASSAWGSGKRVPNGCLNQGRDGRRRKGILSYAKEAGKRTGLVTTCRVTHATPAGFVADVSSREMEHEIARQYLERGVDVILGGGLSRYTKKEADGSLTNYIPGYQSAGYVYAKDRSELKSSANAKKLLGLFADQHIPYALDRKNDPQLSACPGLLEMFETALTSLSQSEEGFFLQVEGGRVDHAGHANDPAAILHEYLEFDECIPLAIRFAEENPDTLLIVTTDHGTGGCQLDGTGERYRGSGPALDRINDFKFSYEWLDYRFREKGRFDADDLFLALGIEATQAQADIVNSGLDRQIQYLTTSLLEAFGAQVSHKTAVGWSSQAHTAECVDLALLGPGVDHLPGYIQNEDLFGIMMQAMGLPV